MSRLSTASTTQGYSQSVSSPYSGQARLLQQTYHGSPLIQSKPAKRSGTPEHVLSEAGVEMRQLGRGGGGGGVNTVVSSPGRQSLQSQYHSATPGPPGPLYSQASRGLTPSTTYNPGYQEQSATRRYLSEGELLGEGGQMLGQAVVGPSSSAGHIQDLAASSPQRQLYYGHTQPGPPTSDPASPLHSHSYAQQVRLSLSHWSDQQRYSLLIGRDLSYSPDR